MSNNLALHVTFTSQQIERLRKQYPDLAEDAELLADTLAGETEFEPILQRVVHEAMIADSQADGVKKLEEDLKQRRERLTRKTVALRGMAMKLMRSAGVDTAILPGYSLSVRAGSDTVSIIDIDALPQGTFTTERKPDKVAIKRLIDADEDVPGAAIVTGENTLQVRIK